MLDFLHKIEFKNVNRLKTLIDTTYFKNGLGKHTKTDEFIILTKDDEDYINFKNMDNMPIKIINDNIINGALKVMVCCNGDIIIITPISIYCIIDEDGRYDFY